MVVEIESTFLNAIVAAKQLYIPYSTQVAAKKRPRPLPWWWQPPKVEAEVELPPVIAAPVIPEIKGGFKLPPLRPMLPKLGVIAVGAIAWGLAILDAVFVIRFFKRFFFGKHELCNFSFSFSAIPINVGVDCLSAVLATSLGLAGATALIASIGIWRAVAELARGKKKEEEDKEEGSSKEEE